MDHGVVAKGGGIPAISNGKRSSGKERKRRHGGRRILRAAIYFFALEGRPDREKRGKQRAASRAKKKGCWRRRWPPAGPEGPEVTRP